MKTLIFLLTVVASSFTGFGQVNPQSSYVNGYYRANGTFVDGYYRTTPNNTVNDNYSTYPNLPTGQAGVNPYTGTTGTTAPSISNYYTQPTLSAPTYNSTPTYSSPTYSYPSYTIYAYPSYMGISYP